MNKKRKSNHVMESQSAPNAHGIIAVLGLVLTLAAASSVRAQEHPCGADIDTVRVIYVNQVTNSLDSRTDSGADTPRVKLRGSLHYKTPEPGTVLKNRPVLIFNHGHEQKRGEACEIVKFFTNKNWVVFVPLRRGHYLDINEDDDFDADVDIRSTGIHVDKFVEACARSQGAAESSGELTHLYCGSGFCRAGLACDTQNFQSAIELDYLSQQKIDVRDQIAFIKSYPATSISDTTIKHFWKLADPGRIVILGHSYGGGLMVFTNTEDYGQSVAIDIQGAELSWDNVDEPYWAWDLQSAMFFQKQPIYFLQPKNGLNLGPTKGLFALAVHQQYRSQAAIFPPAPCTKYGTDADGNKIEIFSTAEKPCPNSDVTPEPKQFHGSFIGHIEQVIKWGPSVIEFATRNQR